MKTGIQLSGWCRMLSIHTNCVSCLSSFAQYLLEVCTLGHQARKYRVLCASTRGLLDAPFFDADSFDALGGHVLECEEQWKLIDLDGALCTGKSVRLDAAWPQLDSVNEQSAGACQSVVATLHYLPQPQTPRSCKQKCQCTQVARVGKHLLDHEGGLKFIPQGKATEIADFSYNALGVP